MTLLINLLIIALAIFALGLCIFVHELGHFLAARKRGLKVERFSIGFGKPIFKWTRDGVEYRISWLPFGGYVALPQLADMGRLEGGDEELVDGKLPPISYSDKMIVAVMGAVFNMIFALFLSVILWIVGQEVVQTTVVDTVYEEIVTSDGERVTGPAYAAGIRPGDEIVRVDGSRVRDWMQLNNAILTGTRRSDDGRPEALIEVNRNGEFKAFTVNPVLFTAESIRGIGVSPDAELIIVGLQEGMPAMKAGMQPGDTLLALDGEPILNSAFLQSTLARHQGGPIDLLLLRDGEEITLSIEPVMVAEEDRFLFGFIYNYRTKSVVVHRNPIEQIVVMGDTIRRTLVALFHQQSDVRPKHMSGPVGIVYGLSTVTHYGFTQLIWFLAFINVNLAILNLLPIPVLDGGHMLFATISKIAGRPLPRKFMEMLQGAFVILLLTFVVYVTFFDVGRVGRELGFGGSSGPAIEEVEEP